MVELRVRVRVISQSHYHMLDDIVTVIVTNHEVIRKDIEGSGRIMLYNI